VQAPLFFRARHNPNAEMVNADAGQNCQLQRLALQIVLNN
jgi:hypothetical protein